MILISGAIPLESVPDKDQDENGAIAEPRRRDFKPDFEWVSGRLARKEQMLGRKLSHEENCTKSLPQALIVGVMKCGTEALSTFLAIHPDIAMQLKLQTVCFFNDHYMQGLDWYKDQMPCSSKGQITIEKSPQYFTSRFVPERIYEMNSSIKLIMIMREPIKRAISHYTHVLDIKPGLYPHSFEQTITGPLGNIDSSHETISRSLYSVQLKRWLEYFKIDQIHIVNADNFKVNQAEELNKIEKFLGLRHYITKDFFTYNEEKGFYCLSPNATGSQMGCMASGKGRQHPEVSQDMMERLQKYFKPFNEELFRIIGERFDWGY